MKTKAYQQVQLSDCLLIPRYNYRQLDSSEKDLQAFADRILSEGLLTPIRIAQFSDQVLSDSLLQELCQSGNQLLLDGERRLIALSLIQDKQQFSSIPVEYFQVDSLKEFLALQMTFNLDRKNTNFTEDGFGFQRFLENGGTKSDLLSCINFPANLIRKKDRLKYITERIDLLKLHPDLHPFLNNGLIRAYKSKPHQGYLILGFSQLHQQALAAEFSESPSPKSDDAILGFFNRFRTRFDNPPFNPDDEDLAIEQFNTASCTGCMHLKTMEEEDWGGTIEQHTYCYLSKCFEAKAILQNERLQAELSEKQQPFVLLGAAEKNWNTHPAEEELPNGQIKLRYYAVVEQGACSHAIAGIPDFDATDLQKGQIHFVCPQKSACSVHHPEKEVQKQQNRTSRLGIEKLKLEKSTHIQTAKNWALQLLHQDYTPILPSLIQQYFLRSFEFFFRASDSDTQNTFRQLIQETEEKPFKAWSSNAIQAGFATYGQEKACLALLLAHLIHDFRPDWDVFDQWGKDAQLDFKSILEENLKANLQELESKHEKRKQGWTKEQEVLQKKMHALCFDLPLLCIDWEKEAALLERLQEEKFGKKLARLIGVKLPKDAIYVPIQMLDKLRGRKAELEALFPKYQLAKPEKALLETFQSIPSTPLPELIPESIQFGSGQTVDFVKAGIKLASQQENNIVLAEFLNAKVLKTKVRFTLLHRDTIALIKKIIQQEKLTGYVQLDKPNKTLLFLQKE
jgi:hypothetical protein